MSDPIRYGIIGTGMMGCEHIRNIKALPDAVVTAVADPFEPSRAAAAAALGEWAEETAFYRDGRQLIRDAPIDALVIATPNHSHKDVLETVWGRPLHVLVEKPLCTTLEDCRSVCEAASSHPGVVWVGLEYRYMAPVARFVRALKSGEIGALKMLFIREHRFPFLPKVAHWNRFNRNTGGTLVEKCCHFFDLMNLVVGTSPLRVMASGAQDVNHLEESYEGETPDILDNAFVLVDYEGGVRACLDLCMFAEGSRCEQELVATGDGGKLEVRIPQDEWVISTRGGRDFSVEKVPPDPRVAHVGFHHGASYVEHLAFAEAIRSGQPAEVGAEDGLRSVAIGVAAQRSIEEGRAIEMRELDSSA